MEILLDRLFEITCFIIVIVALFFLVSISFENTGITGIKNKKLIDKAIQEYFKCQKNEYNYRDCGDCYKLFFKDRIYEFKCSKNKPLKIVCCKKVKNY